jgi:hypothetical protein
MDTINITPAFMVRDDNGEMVGMYKMPTPVMDDLIAQSQAYIRIMEIVMEKEFID